MANILDVKSIIRDIEKELIEERKLFGGLRLVSLKTTDDEATDVYVASQRKWADMLGIDYFLLEFERNSSLEYVLNVINELNRDKTVNGIIIHKPLPSDWDEAAIFEKVDIKKDIEGLNPYNLGKVFLKKYPLLPPTVLSVTKVIEKIGIDLYGKNAVIVGFSNILGKPLSIMLADKFATVSVTHIGTFEKGKLPYYVKEADILITAVGKPHLIKGDWIKKGAVVIDVGISKLKGRLVGDVEFDKAKKQASFITPVPGGVGTLTVAFLYKNLLRAAGMQDSS